MGVPMPRPLPVALYFIFLSRAEKRPITKIWPLSLKEPLPVAPIPLLPDDEEIALDVHFVCPAPVGAGLVPAQPRATTRVAPTGRLVVYL